MLYGIYPSHINFDMRKCIKLIQFHQFETGCTNLYTPNALEVYKFVHLIFKVHKFVHPMFVVHTSWIKWGVQICTPCSFPQIFSLKITIDVEMTVKKRIFWQSCWNVASFIRKRDRNVDQKSTLCIRTCSTYIVWLPQNVYVCCFCQTLISGARLVGITGNDQH